MNIDKGIEMIQVILDNQQNNEFVYLYQNDLPLFDSILIKPLKKRHIVSENILEKFTRDSDIRLEGNEKNIFPFIQNYRYENQDGNKGHYKKWYLTQIPVRFSLENCHHLFETIPGDNSKGRINYFKTKDYEEGSFINAHLSKEKREGERLSLGYKDIDDEAFHEFRKLLFDGDYLIVCKYYGEARFLFLGAKEADLKGLTFNINKSVIFLEERFKTKHYTSFSIQNIKEVYVKRNIPEPNQLLISGAPGTGKSYHLKEKTEQYFPEDNIHRVTFHPTYTYGQFVGTFKPKQNSDNITTYGYQIGTLMKVLIKALKNPNENYAMIVEEINRGNANEIFGDFLQLIERGPNGNSVYQIEPSEDLLFYIKNNHPELPEKLFLPSNLYIWATLNFSDQHSFPIDAAFFRRWSHYHFNINEKEEEVEDFVVMLPGRKDPINWNVIRKSINQKLSSLSFIKEDQMLGPYFMKNPVITSDQFFYDVVLYLKENVLRDFSSHLFIYQHTSDLNKAFNEGRNIFHFTLG